jgi:23S rRNA (guanosine2251-2'-O)-methyltransferase
VQNKAIMNTGKQQKPSLYGFHAVREAWLNPERTVQALYITDQAKNGFEPVITEARGKGLRRPVPVRIEKHQLEKMLPRDAVHQGLALACNRLDDIFIQDFIIKADQQDHTVLLMLDQVTDPHNVGAILRSACAFGATGVIMQKKHAPELEGVLAKAASGAAEHIPVAYETNLSRALEELKEAGFFVFGLDERGQRSIDQVVKKSKTREPSGDMLQPSTHQPGKEKIVLVLGAEGPGMRRLVSENCDELVKLPTQGAISSLNVSNAAAVALYELCKKG